MDDGSLNFVVNTFNTHDTFHRSYNQILILLKKIAEYLFTNTLKFYKRNTD